MRVNWDNEVKNWQMILVPTIVVTVFVTIVCFVCWYWNDPFPATRTNKPFSSPGGSAFVGFFAGLVSGIAFGLVNGTFLWAVTFFWRMISFVWNTPKPVSSIKANAEPLFKSIRHRLDLSRQAVKDIRDDDAIREIKHTEDLLLKLERILQ